MGLFGKKKKAAEAVIIPSLEGLESSFGDEAIIEESEDEVMVMMGERDASNGKLPVFTDDKNYMKGFNSEKGKK